MKNRNIIESFNNAVNGIISAIKSERNMKVHLVTAAAVLLLSLFYDLTRLEFLIVCLSIALVIICELFNTAVEALIDTFVDGYHPKVKIIKDSTAGAVLVSAFFSLVVAYFIFYDRFSSSLISGIHKIRQVPMHLTVIALVITLLIVLAFKAFIKKGTPFSGGMPSGYSAIAFSLVTAIALWTGNAGITVLAAVIGLLVVQSRLESHIHDLPELIAGAVLGFLITLLLFQMFY